MGRRWRRTAERHDCGDSTLRGICVRCEHTLPARRQPSRREQATAPRSRSTTRARGPATRQTISTATYLYVLSNWRGGGARVQDRCNNSGRNAGAAYGRISRLKTCNLVVLPATCHLVRVMPALLFSTPALALPLLRAEGTPSALLARPAQAAKAHAPALPLTTLPLLAARDRLERKAPAYLLRIKHTYHAPFLLILAV